MKLTDKKYINQYLVTLAGSFSVITSGVNLGWTSPYLPILLNNSTSYGAITNSEGSWCAVMPLVGAPLGAFLCAVFVDKIGRKPTVLWMAPITAVAWIAIAYAKSIFVLSTARFLIGSVEGGLYTVLPMYFGEIADPEIRGLLTATITIAGITGTLFIYIIGPFLCIFESSWICCAIPVLHFIAFLLCPESPYYLIKIKQLEKAEKSLKLLRRKEDVSQEFQSIYLAVNRQEQNPKTKLTDLFTVKSNRKAVFIYIMLSMTNKFSGKNPLVFYAETIFETAEGSIRADYSVIICGSVELLATLVALFLVDRFGRRPLMMFSALGCALALSIEGTYFYLKETTNASLSSFGWIPITALLCYNTIFSMGLAFGPVVILSEMFPTNIKAAALSLADTYSITMGTIAAKCFQIMKDEAGMFLPFWTFSACCFIGLLFIVRFMPETKGKTLEEIQISVVNASTVQNKEI